MIRWSSGTAESIRSLGDAPDATSRARTERLLLDAKSAARLRRKLALMEIADQHIAGHCRVGAQYRLADGSQRRPKAFGCSFTPTRTEPCESWIPRIRSFSRSAVQHGFPIKAISRACMKKSRGCGASEAYPNWSYITRFRASSRLNSTNRASI